MRISVRPRRDGIKGWAARLLMPKPINHPGWLAFNYAHKESYTIDLLLESPGARMCRHIIEGPIITTWSPNGDEFKVDGFEMVVARDGVPV